MRIGIVNDLRLAREALRRIVLSRPADEVAWTAVDGEEAVALAGSDPPDLILMDLMLPKLDGVEATRRIMSQHPCAILVVTSSVAQHMPRVYEAMGHGALGAVDTPSLRPDGGHSGIAELSAKIDIVAKLLGGSSSSSSLLPAQPSASRESRPGRRPPLALLGTSTGGPRVIAEMLGGWPGPPESCVVVVQHMDESFADGLARWLGERCRLGVERVRDGQGPEAGKVLVAACDRHVAMGPDGRFSHTDEPRESCYHPSVDVLFRSVAEHWPAPGAAALLTGMGRDGAEGLKALRARGWRTYAQAEAGCPVWGMPKAAVEIGAASEILGPADIARSMAAHLSPASSPAPPRHR